jgi:DNA-binding NarL/FixJ family response regulator
LVEESETILESLRAWINVAFPDVQVIEATTHRDRIRLSRSESPDVLLLDISGLGRDGLDTLQSIRTAHPRGVVVALVAVDHESYRRAVLGAGAEACARLWRVRTELMLTLRAHLASDPPYLVTRKDMQRST